LPHDGLEEKNNRNCCQNYPYQLIHRDPVDNYLKATGKVPGEFLFTSRRRVGEAMTTRQYARLVAEWIAGIGLDPHHLIFEGTLGRFPGLKVLAAHGGGYLGSYAPRSDHACFVSPMNCNPDIKLKKKPTEFSNT
jgi:hypothetical protein